MLELDLSESELSVLRTAVACRLDDYKAEIRRTEKQANKRAVEARKQWSILARIMYLKLAPDSLCGEFELMDGTTIVPDYSDPQDVPHRAAMTF